MKWFKHESDAHTNPKLQQVVEKFGLRGYGYYWGCLEIVAKEGEDYRIKRSKEWQFMLKKFLNIEVDEQKQILVFLARKDLIDKEALKIGDLYIPKLEERCDEYTEKIRRKSGQDRDSVGVEEIRREEIRREGKNPNQSVKYLDQIPEEDLEIFYQRFDCSKNAIISKAEDLRIHCIKKGKAYSNYKALLLGALKKDFPERTPAMSALPREESGSYQVPVHIKKEIEDIVNNKKVK